MWLDRAVDPMADMGDLMAIAPAEPEAEAPAPPFPEPPQTTCSSWTSPR
jgi:hypothetical protein